MAAVTERAFSAVAVLWAGMVLGVSFFATPVKFMAASLPRPAAFEVTGVTFAAFRWVEIAFLLVLVVLWALGERRRLAGVGLALLALAVGAQAFVLLPELLARTDLVLRGEPLPPSSLHTLYSGIEVGKLAVLLGVGVLAGRRTAGAPSAGGRAGLRGA